MMKKFFAIILFFSALAPQVFAQVLPKVTLGFEEATSVDDVAVTLEIVALMTVLTLAPSIIIMLTSFTRIVIVLNFLKQALGTMNAPPNQVIMGLTLFLTFFIMTPTFNAVNDNALQPYLAKEINHEVAITEALKPIRDFMLRQTSESELALFLRVSKT